MFSVPDALSLPGLDSLHALHCVDTQDLARPHWLENHLTRIMYRCTPWYSTQLVLVEEVIKASKGSIKRIKASRAYYDFLLKITVSKSI